MSTKVEEVRFVVACESGPLAGLDDTVSRWTGTAWESISRPGGMLQAVPVSATEAWAADGAGAIWHWAAGSWTAVARAPRTDEQ
jgi:hypothetical protein